MKVLDLAGNEDILTAFSPINKRSWPKFLIEGSEPVPDCWITIMSDFAHCQLALIDDAGVPIAIAHGVPVAWNGEIADLPSGWDDSISRSIAGLENDTPPNTLTALSITISPEHKGQGLSYLMLNALKTAAIRSGYKYLIVPVRPSLKPAHPLVPMQEYIEWRDEKGQYFDPWLRVHIKSGGQLLCVCQRSMTVKAPISKWEAWTGMNFPASGDYCIPNALAPVHIAVDMGIGIYVEPNVWIQHFL